MEGKALTIVDFPPPVSFGKRLQNQVAFVVRPIAVAFFRVRKVELDDGSDGVPLVIKIGLGIADFEKDIKFPLSLSPGFFGVWTLMKFFMLAVDLGHPPIGGSAIPGCWLPRHGNPPILEKRKHRGGPQGLPDRASLVTASGAFYLKPSFRKRAGFFVSYWAAMDSNQ